MFGQRPGGGGFRFSPKLLIAIALAAFALFKYFGNTSVNEITGEKQHVSLTPQEEIAMGLQSAPEMAAQFGGLSNNQEATALVKRVGERVVAQSAAAKTPYQYEFHLLADPQTVNAFALPGGQIFITEALLGQLENEDQLAGVLGHEVGHVVARHSAERLAQMELSQGLTGAVTMATYDPSNPNSGYLAQVVANMIVMKYGRDQELESDDLGVRFMMESDYQPEHLIGVMEILKKASGPSETPEFQSTHPAPENRAAKIREAIEKYQAQGVN
jgi:predicted Zn-dependent protease